MTKSPSLKRDPSLLIFVATFVMLLLGARTQGIVRDEAYYFRAGEFYTDFVKDFGTGKTFRQIIDGNFGYNHEHPAFIKILFGASWRLFHGVVGLDEVLAFRLPTILLVALLAVLIYRMGNSLLGPLAGLLAAAFLVFQPHLFFHSQLACFDAPIMVLWVAIVWAYARAISSQNSDDTRRFSRLTGLLFGISLGIKFNTMFLPIFLFGHYVYVRLRGREASSRPFIAMAIWGPILFIDLWPYLWFDTFARIREYLGFHMHHWHYNFEFLGTNYNNPPYPWTVPWVGLALTLPLAPLVLGLGQIASLARTSGFDEERSEVTTAHPMALIVLNALAPLAILDIPGTPIFGGVKHYLAAYPFWALLAGLGLTRLCHALRRNLEPKRGRAVTSALLAVSVAGPALDTYYAHPDGLSHYNAIAGGFAGGADLGMNRQFWGYSPAPLFPWMNEHLADGTRLYLHDLNYDSFRYYQRTERLRGDFVYAGMEEAGVASSKLALVIHEKHFQMYDFLIWQVYGTATPTRVLEREGVPLVSVYER